MLAALGITAFCVPEARGGFGCRADAAVATAMELGAALHGSPYAGLTASAHVLGATDHDLLGAVLTGERICAFTRAHRDPTVATVVDGAMDADALLVDHGTTNTFRLFPTRDGWSASAAHSFDVSRRCANVIFDSDAGIPLPTSATARNLFRVLLTADAVGGVQRMLDRTVAYARERQAFGRPLGGFQAVQHRLVDHAVRARGMVLLVKEAARLLGDRSPAAARCLALAEVSVSSGATHILHDLLQLTGAIGFTWDYGLHFFERRAHQDARLAANPRAAIASLAGIEGWIGAG